MIMKSYDLLKATVQKDEYGNKKTVYSSTKKIECFISTLSQTINLNNPLYLESTHIAITNDFTVQAKDRISNYEVMYVNSDGRFNQLFMKAVK